MCSKHHNNVDDWRQLDTSRDLIIQPMLNFYKGTLCKWCGYWWWQKLIFKVYYGKIRLALRLHWPQQPLPSNADWAVWKKIWRKDFLLCPISLSLRIALVPWWDSSEIHHRQWKALYDPDSVRVFIRSNGKWNQHKVTAARNFGSVNQKFFPQCLR